MLSQHTGWFVLVVGLTGCSALTDVDRTKIVDPMFVRPPPSAGGSSGKPSAGAPAAGGGGAGAAGTSDAGPDAG